MYPGAYVDRFPDKPAVIVAETGETLTYQQLEERSLRLARVLYDAGLRRGDHLALLTDNTPRAFEVYWAALRSGLYITAVNSHLTPAEISYIVNDCDAKAIVVSGRLREVAEPLVAAAPELVLRLVYGGPVEGYASYDDALWQASDEPLPAQPRGIDMLYSSGTTGFPKGIKPPLPDLSIDDVSPDAALYGPMYGFDTETVYLSPAPIYHAAPLRFAAVIQSLGGTVVMMERFDAEAALAAIEQHRVTHSQWVPTMFVRMLKLDESVRQRYDVTSMRCAVHAAAPCPVEVKQEMIDWWGPILIEYYSATELNGVTMISSAQWSDKPGSVGRAVVGILHICDEDGTELPVGEIGTVYFERDELPFHYHKDPAKTAAAAHPQHPTWTTTGDIGRVDADGFLYLTDRKGFTIISGGVNIYPQEIENTLILHPKVLDVAVLGVPDPDFGEAVKAFVQPADGVPVGDPLAAELIEFLADRIARYKLPRSVQFVEALPRTQTGKLLKRKLREPDVASA